MIIMIIKQKDIFILLIPCQVLYCAITKYTSKMAVLMKFIIINDHPKTNGIEYQDNNNDDKKMGY